jgi:glyoxylase I family protein
VAPPTEVLGVEHVDLTVNDLARSTRFYDRVLGALGFRRVSHATYVGWANAHLTIGLRAAVSATGAVFDRHRVGLHHLALRVRSRDDVDRLHDFLAREGVTILDPPAEHPEYGQGYYAVYFADPDGMKLEAVHFPSGYWRKVQSEGGDERPRYRAPG